MNFGTKLLVTIVTTLCTYAPGINGDGVCLNNVTANALRPVAERFLLAVKERDFETFKTYFNDQLPFHAELPGNKIFNDVPSFMKSQEPWFQGTTGNFGYQVQDVTVDSTLGTTTNLIEYSNVDATGVPFTLKILITLKFQYQDSKWFVVYDHNQVLEKR
jgi:hypothetical protein